MAGIIVLIVFLAIFGRAFSGRPNRLGPPYRYNWGSGVVVTVILLLVVWNLAKSERSENWEDRETHRTERMPQVPTPPAVPEVRVTTRQQKKRGSAQQVATVRNESIEVSADDGDTVIETTIAAPASTSVAKTAEKPAEAWPKPSASEPATPESAHQPVELAQKVPGEDTTPWRPAIAIGARPAWVDAPPTKIDGVFHTKASSGPNATRADCEDALDKDLRKVVSKYIEDLSGDDDLGGVDVPLSYIKKNLIQGDLYEERIETQNVGPWVQLHAHLAFDARVQGELKDRERDVVVTRRLKTTAGGAAAVLGLLAAAFGYLKIDMLTAGRYRWRLRLAALAIPPLIWLAWVAN